MRSESTRKMNLDRTWFRSMVPARGDGFFAGSVLAALLFAGILAPRITPFIAGIVSVYTVVLAAANGNWRKIWMPLAQPSLIVIGLLAFGTLACLSALWAVAPWRALAKGGLTISIALMAIVAITLIEESRSRRLAEGLAIGVAAGCVYVGLEIVSQFELRMAAYNYLGFLPIKDKYHHWEAGRIVRIDGHVMNRSIALLVILLWPALLAIDRCWFGICRQAWKAALLSAIALVTFYSVHESSKIAMMVGCIAWILSKWWPKWWHRAIMTAWIIATLFMPLLASAAYTGLKLHQADWLQYSARDRIVIWGYASELVRERPLLGFGADSNYVMGRSHTVSEHPRDHPHPRSLAPHPHNVFLQVWFELGLAGAVILMLLGRALLNALSLQPEEDRALGYATFASCATLATFTWSLWQAWFLGAFCLAAVSLRLALHLSRAPRNTDSTAQEQAGITMPSNRHRPAN